MVLVPGEFWVRIRFDLETFIAGKVEVPQILIEIPNRMVGVIERRGFFRLPIPVKLPVVDVVFEHIAANVQCSKTLDFT
jgi:hypothetical protein